MARFFVLGGECNYLFQCSVDAKLQEVRDSDGGALIDYDFKGSSFSNISHMRSQQRVVEGLVRMSPSTSIHHAELREAVRKLDENQNGELGKWGPRLGPVV